MKYKDAVASSSRDALFRSQLHCDEPARCLFVDDSLSVLRAARHHGIGQIFAVSRPDSAGDRRSIDEFPAVPAIVDLLR